MALLGKFLAKMLYPTVFRRAPRTPRTRIRFDLESMAPIMAAT